MPQHDRSFPRTTACSGSGLAQRAWAYHRVGKLDGLHTTSGWGMAAGLPNKGMKLTKLSPAPGQMEAPSSALQRFALVRTASQLIPGVRRTRHSKGKEPADRPR
jgi:hypothetical protein